MMSPPALRRGPRRPEPRHVYRRVMPPPPSSFRGLSIGHADFGAAQLREGGLLLQPGLVVFLRVEHHDATHEPVADAAELGTEHLEGAGANRREPEIGDRSRY